MKNLSGALFGKKEARCVVLPLSICRSAVRRDAERPAVCREVPVRAVPLRAERERLGRFRCGAPSRGKSCGFSVTLDEMIEGLSGLRGLNVKEREEAWADDRFGA